MAGDGLDAEQVAVGQSQTETNPAGVPQAAFEGLQAQLAANRSEFYRAVPSGPFYNFDQPGVEPSEATTQ